MNHKQIRNLLVITLLLTVSLTSSVIAADNGSIEVLRKTGRAFNLVAEKALPGVVSIKTKTTVTEMTPLEEEFRRFFRGPSQRAPQERTRQGQGSGFIISRDGYILTNNHVIAGADEITVTLTDGRELDAELIGADDKTDVAVIQVEGDDLHVVELGNSDNLQIGEWSIAVGNPFGLDATVTVGVISAKGRKFTTPAEGYGDYIQTDAAINPGNSGGPLLNIDGQAIGINTLIVSQSGGYMGIGFAIPINMAKIVKDQLIATGKVEFGFLGIRFEEITLELAKYYDLDEAAGTLTLLGGAIPDPSDIKITYQSESQLFLTEFRNLILGIGRDIRMERDRPIFASVSEFALTARVAVEIEETDAVVLGINVGLA